MQVAINNINLPSAAVPGSSNATNVTTILNDGACSTSPVVTFSATENGASSTEFSANTTGSCSSTPTGGASFATNVTFNPTVAGTHIGILTAVDTVNGGIGTANVFGVTAGSAAATPTFSPAPGTYTSVQTVTISDATPGATIYYTTDGTTPTTGSTKYTGVITVSSTETINAIAVVSGLSNSAVATGVYTLNLPLAQTPVISVPTGTYTSIQTVKITDATLGAKIYYTTDGSTPTASSTQYKSPLTVSTTQTLNAVAIAPGYAPSVVATAIYTMNLTVTPPRSHPRPEPSLPSRRSRWLTRLRIRRSTTRPTARRRQPARSYTADRSRFSVRRRSAPSAQRPAMRTARSLRPPTPSTCRQLRRQPSRWGAAHTPYRSRSRSPTRPQARRSTTPPTAPRRRPAQRFTRAR